MSDVDMAPIETVTQEPAARPASGKFSGLLATAGGMGLLGLFVARLGLTVISMAAETPAEFEAVSSAHNPWVIFYGGGAIALVSCWVLAVGARVTGRWRGAAVPLAVASLVTSMALILTFGAVLALAFVGLLGQV